MKLYISVNENRQTDIQFEVFTTLESAITHAEETAYNCMGKNDYYGKATINGYLYIAYYGDSGNCVYVVEKELQSDLLCTKRKQQARIK